MGLYAGSYRPDGSRSKCEENELGRLYELSQQIYENIKRYGVPVVVAINQFKDDTPAEIELIRQKAVAAGAEDAVLSTHWANGGDGAIQLAEAVIAACEKPSAFRFLYPLRNDF
jgi:formyltetrahydrofolate synthetase